MATLVRSAFKKKKKKKKRHDRNDPERGSSEPNRHRPHPQLKPMQFPKGALPLHAICISKTSILTSCSRKYFKDASARNNAAVSIMAKLRRARVTQRQMQMGILRSTQNPHIVRSDRDKGQKIATKNPERHHLPPPPSEKQVEDG